MKAKFDVQGKGFIPKAEEILEGFADELNTYGIGSIGEIFDGDPPHHARGSISQAWSVGGVLYIKQLVEKYKAKTKTKTKGNGAETIKEKKDIKDDKWAALQVLSI